MPFEIIEIGAIKLDENRREIGRFSEMVRPLVYPTLHYRTKEITSLDQNQLRRSRTFCPVVRDFLKWCGDDCKFVTWGNLDLTELQQNMDYYRLANPFPKPLFYCDLQKMFSILYFDGKSRMALEEAVEYLHIPKDIEFHRAFDDTYYTAEVMKKMDFEKVKSMSPSTTTGSLPIRKKRFCAISAHTRNMCRSPSPRVRRHSPTSASRRCAARSAGFP
jgi:inhibitor of KinA sporulation pathway (predicted exonuclease)